MKLTELEGAALGLVWLRGTATAYELRKMVAESPTPQWSASAGTVYPLVEKLCRKGLVSFSRTGDRRGTRLLRITEEGRRAFKAWMLDCTPTVIGVPPDPVRTRIRFLEFLSASQGSRLLEQFERRLRSQLAHMRTGRRAAWRGASPGESLALRGARLAQEGRIEWIRSTKEWVKRAGFRKATR